MKIDDQRDALAVAHGLADASAEKIAKALLEAHLEGVEQGRSLLLQGKSVDEVIG